MKKEIIGKKVSGLTTEGLVERKRLVSFRGRISFVLLGLCLAMRCGENMSDQVAEGPVSAQAEKGPADSAEEPAKEPAKTKRTKAATKPPSVPAEGKKDEPKPQPETRPESPRSPAHQFLGMWGTMKKLENPILMGTGLPERLFWDGEITIRPFASIKMGNIGPQKELSLGVGKKMELVMPVTIQSFNAKICPENNMANAVRIISIGGIYKLPDGGFALACTPDLVHRIKIMNEKGGQAWDRTLFINLANLKSLQPSADTWIKLVPQIIF